MKANAGGRRAADVFWKAKKIAKLVSKFAWRVQILGLTKSWTT